MDSVGNFGLEDATLDVYFQKSRNPWRCHRSSVVFLNNEKRLLPGSNCSCQKHQEHPIRSGACGSFDASAEDNELLAQERVFCHEFRLAFGNVCQDPQQERGGGVRFGPVDEAGVE